MFPKKVKYRKWHRMRKNPKKKRVATSGITVAFGSHGLKVERAGEITANQIEAGRRVLSRFVQKTGKVWLRVFPDKPLSKKPPEVTMGGGKGDPAKYVVDVKAGRVIFEVDGLPGEKAKEALRSAGSKLPLKTRIISRNVE